MEFRGPAKGTYLDHDTEGGLYRYYYTDEKLYLLNPTGLVYYDRRVGEQMPGYPAYYATSLITTNNSLGFGSWNLYVHPKIQQQIKTEHPLMDSNSVVRFSFWPSGNINFYYVGGETKWLPFGIYYARKNWIEAEWVTSQPNDVSHWVDTNLGLAGNFAYTTATYINNITSLSGEYYPKYTLGTGDISIASQVVVRAGQNILLNSQTNASENGVYRVTTGAWIKLSQPIYPAVVMVWGYALGSYLTYPYGGSFYVTNYTYNRGAGSDRNFLQTSDSNFSASFVGTGYPASHGFYLYRTLTDALANTNQITYALVNSTENVNTDPLVFSIDENNVQHSNKPDYLLFSPIDYTYPSFRLLKGIGCCDQSYVDIVSSDIPDNMSFDYMGQSVSLKRFSEYLPEIVTEAEVTAYYATHSRNYNFPPLRWLYYKEFLGTTYYKEDMFKVTATLPNAGDNGTGIMPIMPASAMFGGHTGIDLKTPTNFLTFNPTNYSYTTDAGWRTGAGTLADPYVYHDLNGRRAYFWAKDLNTIVVAILYTTISYYMSGTDYQTVHTDGDIVLSGSRNDNLYGTGFQFQSAAWATYTNATPNSTSRTATFNIVPTNTIGTPVYWSGNTQSVYYSYGGDTLQKDFLATMPTSITVNRGGEFTLPNQLRLNMPSCFFANQYTDIDTTSLVKGTTKIVQDPISIGSVNVVLTLDKTDGAYYSEMMTLGVIKGRFRILTNAYKLNTGNWVADHSIIKEPLGSVEYGSYYRFPNTDLNTWNLAGYGSYGTSTPYNASFQILGSIYLADTSYSGYTRKDFNYRDINPQWYVANDELGGYTTGLSQGTVWMDTRVTRNDKKYSGAHLNATPNNAAWCAVIFSEWQELRSPATSSELRDNTIGPPIINNVYDASISGSTAIASSYTLGGPSWTPTTDFYKRNHYFVQSSDPNCWLSSLSV